MSSHKIDRSTYVDIATAIARRKLTEEQYQFKTTSIDTDTDDRNIFLEACSIKSEWDNRVDSWIAQFPDNGTPIETASLEDIEIGKIFLKDPILGMRIWNITQELYALDSMVCVDTLDDQTIVMKWRELQIFKYLKKGAVEMKWRNSLKSISSKISKREYPKALDCVSREARVAEKSKTQEVNEVSGQEAPKTLKISLSKRAMDLRCGVSRLEKALSELENTISENMHSEAASEMLRLVKVAADWRFSAISTTFTAKANLCKESPPQVPDSHKTPEPRSLKRSNRSFSFEKSLENAKRAKRSAVTFAADLDAGATLGALVCVMNLVVLLGFVSASQQKYQLGGTSNINPI